MIGFVWCFSALVSLPPLLGWKGKEAEGQCTLSEDLGYVLYSANGSFFIPAIVMACVYARIFVAARSRARRNIKKKKLPVAPSEVTTPDPAKDKSTTTSTSLPNPSPPDHNKVSEDDEETSGSTKGVSVSVICAPSSSPRSSPRLPPILVTPRSHDNGSRTALHSPPVSMSPSALISTPEIVVEATPTPHSSPVKSCDKKVSEDKCVSFRTPTSPLFSRSRQQTLDSSETRFGSEDIEETSIESPVAKNASRGFLTPTSALSKFKASPYGSTLSIADFEDSDLGTDQESDQTKKGKTTPTGKVVIAAPRLATSEAERHKRKVAKARERRATFILGLIMASFIGAWLPFFTMYLIQGICKVCTISPTVFTFAFWLGYCNSAINPIIYTVFNRDFRKAFRKILFR